VDKTDFWDQRSQLHAILGEALLHAGRADEARAEFATAVGVCEEKGALPWAKDFRAQAAALRIVL